MMWWWFACAAPGVGDGDARPVEATDSARFEALEAQLSQLQERVAALEAPAGVDAPAPVRPNQPDLQVRQEGDVRVLQASILSSLVDDPEALAAQVRLTPALTDGNVNGFRLSGMRAGSALAQLGFLNGDIVVGVDERSLRSPSDALEIYGALLAAPPSSLAVKVLRRGLALELRYRIEGVVAAP